MSDQIGTLKTGAWGDAVIFELQEGSFDFSDCYGQVRTGRQRLAPTIVIRGGKLYRAK
jgi:dihydroorotase